MSALSSTTQTSSSTSFDENVKKALGAKWGDMTPVAASSPKHVEEEDDIVELTEIAKPGVGLGLHVEKHSLTN